MKCSICEQARAFDPATHYSDGTQHGVPYWCREHQQAVLDGFMPTYEYAGRQGVEAYRVTPGALNALGRAVRESFPAGRTTGNAHAAIPWPPLPPAQQWEATVAWATAHRR